MILLANRFYVVWLLLAIFIVLTQWGTLDREVINWDESTFILVGARMLEGDWLYVDIFDNKPPMIFVFMASVVATFGKSIVAIRIFGDVCILITCLFAYSIAQRFVTRPRAFAIAGLIAAAHALPGHQHTSSELPATAILMGALWCLITHREKFWALALAGFLISLATLTRTNLAIVAVACGVYLTLGGVFFSQKTALRPWCVLPYTISGLIPVFILFVLYWRIAELETLWLGAVEVPLNYAQNRIGPFGNLKLSVKLWQNQFAIAPILVAGFTLLCSLGLIGTLTKRFAWHEDDRQSAIILLIFLLSVTYSVLNSGYAYIYYWAQIYPFAALLLIGIFTQRKVAPFAPFPAMAMGTCAITIVSMLILNIQQSTRLLLNPDNIAAGHTLHTAASQISPLLGPDDDVWALQNHLVLWYLDKPPVKRIMAHPDNFARRAVVDPLVAAGYTEAGVLQKIYDSKPAFILTEGGQRTPGFMPDKAYFAAYIENNYTVFHSDTLITTYRRIGHGTP